MTATLLIIATALISYFLGGINGAIITSKYLFRKDIREHGSRNAGITNYYRVFGAPGAVLVIVIDILKAVISAIAGRLLLGIVGYPDAGATLATFFVMFGHCYPAFSGFKGGKGVLCCGAAVFVVNWKVGLICIIVFAVILAVTRYVSLASMVGAFCLPIFSWLFKLGGMEGFVGLLCFLLIVIKHFDNINRLLNGREHKFSTKPPVSKKLDE